MLIVSEIVGITKMSNTHKSSILNTLRRLVACGILRM